MNFLFKHRNTLTMILAFMLVFSLSLSTSFAQESTPQADSPISIVETGDGTTIIVGSPEVFGISESLFLAIVTVLGIFIFAGFTGWQQNKTWRGAFDNGASASVEYLTTSGEIFDFSERMLQVVPKRYQHILNDTLDWFDETVDRSEKAYPKHLLEFLKNLTDDDIETRELKE